MANRININFGTIFKRSSCLNSITESKTMDAGRIFNNLDNQLKAKSNDGYVSPSIKNSLRSFIEGICDVDNASKYFRQPLYLMQEFNKYDLNTSRYILTEYTSRILPYVEDLSGIKESVERYDLTDDQKKSIVESATKLIIADRILANHDKISKRFNITAEAYKIKSKGLRYAVESCCSMIDTYTIAPYAKFNLCLEEMGYLFDKEGIQYDKKEFVKLVTEYFLLRSVDLSSKDLKGYRTVIAENCYINDDDISSVNYTQSNYVYNREEPSITKEIEYFLMNQEKTSQGLEDVINYSMRSSIIDIRTNIGKIIWLIWDVYKNDLFDNLQNLYNVWFNNILRRLQDRDVSKFDLDLISKNINSVKDLLVTGSSDDYEYCVKVAKYKSDLDMFIAKISNLRLVNYSNDNLKALEFVNNESVDPIPLKEFKIFKFHNLVRASMNLDKYLKYKAKNIYSKGNKGGRKIIKKIKDVLFSESSNELYSYIGEDCKVDICAAQFYIDENYIEEVHEFFESVCKEFNDQLLCERMDSIRCYYVLNPGIAELRLKDCTPIKLEDIDWRYIRESSNNDLDIYIEQLAYTQACLEAFGQFTESELNINERLTNFFKNPNLTLEHYEVALEALSFLDVDKEQINVFSESFCNYRYNTALLESVITESEYKREINTIKSISEKWVHEEGDIPLDIQLEAFQILSAVLEADNIKKPAVKKPKVGPNNNAEEKKKDNPDTKVDESRKNPFSGINLNSMKLYLEGLKNKMKQMSTKEKEISRNLDNGFRLFVKSMKDALISDRREAIIKGSVIPSFSRCIKIAIGLAGLGLATQNPLIPLLAALGGFAVSKRLTQKERILLLDEIETELQVVDKEISMAESKNQMKKYRTLLKYKKDLQRQYQRIRYNIRVGKDILPGSATGVRNNND